MCKAARAEGHTAVSTKVEADSDGKILVRLHPKPVLDSAVALIELHANCRFFDDGSGGTALYDLSVGLDVTRVGEQEATSFVRYDQDLTRGPHFHFTALTGNDNLHWLLPGLQPPSGDWCVEDLIRFFSKLEKDPDLDGILACVV